jgi:hypothetical protein
MAEDEAMVETKTQMVREVNEAMSQMGIKADLKNPGSAFDVLKNMERVIRGSFGDLIYHYSVDNTDSRKYDAEIYKNLRDSHPIIWAPDMDTMATEAARALKQNIRAENDLMFLDPVVWLYVEPLICNSPASSAYIPMTRDGHVPEPDEIVFDYGAWTFSFLFYRKKEILYCWMFNLIADKVDWLIESGLLIRCPIGEEPKTIQEQRILKKMRFATSPYISIKQHRVQRATRRRVGEEYKNIDEGAGVILLRRAQVEHPPRQSDSEDTPEWSCQWWVSGHWRNQWCPSTESHKPVWIAPYIKGPKDKPLKESVRLMVR